jgi:CheY-like chemotaxis protein/two-component sensor histidine kinase
MSAIEHGVRTQARLIEDLLDVSRIGSGKLRIDTGHVDLAAVLDAAVDTVSPAAHAKGVALRRGFAGENATIDGDAIRLQQVFSNVLGNAVKFTPAGGMVEVCAERKGTDVVVTVHDTGQGIPAELLPHIFDRFRQGEGSARRKDGGLGLGLAIVKHLVELHGGSARAESGGEEAGATLVITLPRATDRPPGEPTSPRAADVNLAGVRLLLVEDDGDAQGLIARILTESQARVEAASSADEALARVAALRPHVLISDIGMPGKDGYQLIREIRRSPENRNLPALALTALARPEDRARALAEGFDAHLPKPVVPNQLLRAVASLVRDRGTTD